MRTSTAGSERFSWYTGNIRSAPRTLNTGSIRYHVHNVFLAQIDGDAQRERTRAMVRQGEPLRAEDEVKLVLAVFANNREQIYPNALETLDILENVPDEDTRDMLMGAVVGLADRCLTDEQRQHLRRRIKVTRIGRSIFEEGLEQGLAQGLEQGRQEGRREGRQEGRREGRQEGRRETRRQMLLELLEARFGPVPDPLRRRVEATDDVALVDHWFRVAARAESIADLEQIIG
jgi:hypothetical protein